MNRIALTLIGVAALALGACSDGTSDSLSGGPGGGADPRDPNATAGSPDNTFDHNNDPAGAAGADFQPPEPAQLKMIGSPEVTSRLHSCGKLTYTSLGDLLKTRGLTGGGTRPQINGQTAPSGQTLYTQGAAALGVANYAGRVPEAPFASTSAMAKMFDIFTMASYDAVAANWNATACPGVKLLGADGKFNKDALSCIMGKPATDEHVAIANDALAKDPTNGAKIAIAALLSAAHTCQ
jgi:hypothetical protein